MVLVFTLFYSKDQMDVFYSFDSGTIRPSLS